MKNKSLLLLIIGVFLFSQAYSQCRIDSLLTYNYIAKTSVKEPAFYSKNIYDGKDSLIGILFKGWNNVSNQFVNSSREDYILNASGKRTRLNYQLWMYNAWKNDAQIDVTLDGNGNETGYLNKVWDSASNSYLTSSRYFIVYNSKNKPTQSLQQSWDNTNTVWLNNSKSDLTYDATDRFIVNQISTRWNVDSNKWINQFKVEYNLKPGGQVRSRLFYYWVCNPNCAWDLSDSNVYNYNQNGRDTLTNRYFSGEIIQKTESIYNSDNCLQFEKYLSWDNADSKFYAGSENHYVYRKKSSDIGAVKSKGLMVYPNPVADKLTIENTSANAYAIRDILSGKEVLKGIIENGNIIIDVSALSNGCYILNLDNTITKLIINH